MKRPHPIDFYVGMSKYFLNLKACEGRVVRPKGFRVIELSEPSPGPFYVYLLLKEGIDTIHALREIRKRLGGKWYHLGLKDAHGVTLQLIGSDSPSEGVYLKLRKGCLVLTPLGRGTVRKDRMWGNAFIIDLEFRCSEPSTLEGKVKVPGYFSYQRFGTARPISHVVGKMILLERWEEAVDVLLGEPTPWESERAKSVRLEYYSEGPRAYLRAPKFMDVERRVALELLKGRPPKRALKRSGLVEFFLHAYQSYLYNKRLSEFEDPCEGPNLLPGPGADGYEELLEEEGVTLEQFKKFGLKAVSRRPCYETYVRTFPQGRGKVTLVFKLPRGYYATSLLREIVRDPFAV